MNIKRKKHLDEITNDKPYIASNTDNGTLKEVQIKATRPSYFNNLSSYDIARANTPYFKNNLQARARFLKNVGTHKQPKNVDYYNMIRAKRNIKDYEKLAEHYRLTDDNTGYLNYHRILNADMPELYKLQDDIIYLQNNYDKYLKNRRTVDSYYDKKYEGNSLKQQGFRYLKRHYPTLYNKLNGITPDIYGTDVFSGKGADVIDLSNNVIRATPKSKQSTLLFNEFVELKNPSIDKAYNYKTGKRSTIGDKHIPVSNISLYQGIQNGKYVVAPLNYFDDTTTVFPVRNVTRELSKKPIKEIYYNVDNLGLPFIQKHNFVRNPYHNAFNLLVDDSFVKYLNARNSDSKYWQLQEDNNERWFLMSDEEGNIIDKKIEKEYDNTRKQIDSINNYYYNKYVKNNEKLNTLEAILDNKANRNIYVTDVDGNKRHISDWNADVLDNKVILGNPEGNSLFIGKFQDLSRAQLDSINNHLKENPSYLIRTDLGSFDQYRLNNPSLEEYLKQYYEHPKADDPNVYTVGTTKQNRKFINGGSIYIKPSHRGRFTALKERTGHSATWFKENGTPAQKKMATFALNAAKWNH